MDVSAANITTVLLVVAQKRFINLPTENIIKPMPRLALA